MPGAVIDGAAEAEIGSRDDAAVRGLESCATGAVLFELHANDAKSKLKIARRNVSLVGMGVPILIPPRLTNK